MIKFFLWTIYPVWQINDFGTLDWLLGKAAGAGWPNNLIAGVFVSIIGWFLNVAGAFAVIAVIISGLMYIMSSGVPEKAEKAKKNLVWAIIAVVIILLVSLIPQWVSIVLRSNPQ